MSKITVVCGIVRNGNSILICRRSSNKSFNGFWEFPGGKVEKGETSMEALKRELREELRMEIKQVQFFFKSKSNSNLEFEFFTCLMDSGFSINRRDHDKFSWVSKRELFDFQLLPVDLEAAYKLNSQSLF